MTWTFLFPLAPAPWLFLQIGATLVWGVWVGLLIRKCKRRGLFALLSAPILWLAWWLIVFAGYLKGCADLGGAGC
jgi:hypothetical protein